MSPLTKDDLKIIREHAVGEYPHECCGIVLGKIGSADENILYRCENIQNRLVFAGLKDSLPSWQHPNCKSSVFINDFG